jgi:DMSO/TMAO reductase YedYZ molybdopterin-dependent catalytic subunit
VEQEVSWTWDELLRLPMTTVTCDIHCVTRWSRLDNRFEGVHIREIVKHVRPKPAAKFVLVHADPDYTTNLALEEVVDDDVLLAVTHDGRPLDPDPAAWWCRSSTSGKAPNGCGPSSSLT